MSNTQTSPEPLAIYENGELANKAQFRAFRASQIAHRAIHRTAEILQNARELIAENRIG